MVSFTPLREETLADQRLYLEGRLVDVTCQQCEARVRVRKNSEYHTSIQWTSDAVARCDEFARTDADGSRAVHESCPRLKASIEHAAKTGLLPMGGTDG
jgi:hypothetical protein